MAKRGPKRLLFKKYFTKLWKGNEKRRRIANRECGKLLFKFCNKRNGSDTT